MTATHTARRVLWVLLLTILLVSLAWSIYWQGYGDGTRAGVATAPLCVDTVGRGRVIKTVCPDSLGRMP